MVTLTAQHELRGIIAISEQPAGSAVVVSAQVFMDSGGLICGEAMSSEQLRTLKPVAQHVKLIVSFSSDGFAAPFLSQLTLRYAK